MRSKFILRYLARCWHPRNAFGCDTEAEHPRWLAPVLRCYGLTTGTSTCGSWNFSSGFDGMLGPAIILVPKDNMHPEVRPVASVLRRLPFSMTEQIYRSWRGSNGKALWNVLMLRKGCLPELLKERQENFGCVLVCGSRTMQCGVLFHLVKLYKITASIEFRKAFFSISSSCCLIPGTHDCGEPEAHRFCNTRGTFPVQEGVVWMNLCTYRFASRWCLAFWGTQKYSLLPCLYYYTREAEEQRWKYLGILRRVEQSRTNWIHVFFYYKATVLLG